MLKKSTIATGILAAIILLLVGVLIWTPANNQLGVDQITKVKVYFSNSKLDPSVSCNTVFYIEREIPKTETIAKAALAELLKGPTEAEKTAGFSTNINPGVNVQHLTIQDGVANVDFNQALNQGVAGSCRVIAIRSQIEQTLQQFPTIEKVVISIDGNTEDILQP